MKEDVVLPDTGCEFSPSCLNCILPKCRYDMTYEERIKNGIQPRRPGRKAEVA